MTSAMRWGRRPRAEVLAAYDRAIDHQRIVASGRRTCRSTRTSSSNIISTGACSLQKPRPHPSGVRVVPARPSGAARDGSPRRSRGRRLRAELAEVIHIIGMFESGPGTGGGALGSSGRPARSRRDCTGASRTIRTFLSGLGGILSDYGMALAALGRHREAIEASAPPSATSAVPSSRSRGLADSDTSSAFITTTSPVRCRPRAAPPKRRPRRGSAWGSGPTIPRAVRRGLRAVPLRPAGEPRRRRGPGGAGSLRRLGDRRPAAGR